MLVVLLPEGHKAPSKGWPGRLDTHNNLSDNLLTSDTLRDVSAAGLGCLQRDKHVVERFFNRASKASVASKPAASSPPLSGTSVPLE